MIDKTLKILLGLLYASSILGMAASVVQITSSFIFDPIPAGYSVSEAMLNFVWINILWYVVFIASLMVYLIAINEHETISNSIRSIKWTNRG